MMISVIDPHSASEEVWIRSGRSLAANGAIMRTSILGCWQYNDEAKVMANTESIARVTHSDPRCIASSIATTVLIGITFRSSFTWRHNNMVTM
jgi:ADP-ribosylglycohydrolase